MDTQTSKVELAKLILELGDPNLINKTHKMLLDKSSQFRKSLTEYEKEEIKLGIEQLNRGERIHFQHLFEVYWRDLAQFTQDSLRKDAYRNMQQQELAYFEDRSTGDLIAILNDDINQLERFLDHGANDLFKWW